ncbi:MAG: hydroxyphenylacetyl-CoA thioesterase PaaI [Rhodospirillaceae bacterium]
MTDGSKAQRTAEAVAEALYVRDAAARGLGITLLEVRPGFARMTMTVRPEMLNAHDICHGGFTFALADTTFAYACNNRNHVTVAAGCDIVYPAAARLGDILTAVAEEKHLRGRSGIYDIAVTSQSGEVVALMRGQSRRIEGKVVPEL